MRRVWLAVACTACAAPGPWDGLFQVTSYVTALDGCSEAALESPPEATHVSVVFGRDPFGNERVQVHLCDRDGTCEVVPRWNGVLQQGSPRRLETANSEILAIERDGQTVCTLAWSVLQLERSGDQLAMEASAWSANLTTNSSVECEAQMDEIRQANPPCDGYWALTARAVD